MQHKVKLTVIDKKLYPELQEQYCADKNAGMCSCYNVGDEFIFERYDTADDFWHIGLNTLRQTVTAADGTAGGSSFPHCSEAWDAISRYIYTGLQGGSIMRGWMADERIMIACCSDGTRPVVFKIERMDYKVLYIEGAKGGDWQKNIKDTLRRIDGVTEVIFCKKFVEVYLEKNVDDSLLKSEAEKCGKYSVSAID